MRLGAAMIGAVALGAGLRLAPVLAGGHPLNDGGLFLAMSRDIRASGFGLPAVVSYNGLDIPFAYPPLGIYLLAFVESLGLSGTDALRIIPVLASICTIPLVFLIGRDLLGSTWMALGAAAFFAVSAGSYEWLVLGGGITRAPGFLVALLGVWLIIRAYRSGGAWPSVIAGAVVGITGLIHLQAGVFAALSAVVLLPLADRGRASISRLLVVALVAVVVVLPWLALTVGRHGLDPLVSAASTAGTPFAGLANVLLSRTSGGEVEVLGYATTLGLLVCVLRRFWLPVIWLLTIVIVDSRAGQPFVAVPAAIAVTYMLRDLGTSLGRTRVSGSEDRAHQVRLATAVLAGVLLLASAADSVVAQVAADSPLRAITSGEREAMAWVAAETEPASDFVVLSGRYWAFDATAEWFPVLAGRRSVATVQGYEWLGADAFQRQLERATALPACVAARDLECVERWFRAADGIDYLFLTRSPVAGAAGLSCCHELSAQVASFRDTDLVYDNGEVLVVRIGEGKR